MASRSEHPQHVGPYEIQEILGRGGMATVYKGMHRQLHTPVAIKVMATHLAHDEAFVKRFVQEAQTTARLSSHHIVTIHDFGEQEDRLYLAMEYVEGPTLKELLGKPMDLRLTVEILRPICEALDVAHANNVIHRDIKPTNILMASDTAFDPVTRQRRKRYRPVLADFGIAKAYSDAQAGLTATGTAVGTPDYMSPEQGMGLSIDRRADIYSLGVVLFEMLTGTRPFKGDTPLAVLSGHVSRELPAPRSINPNIPPAVEAVIKKALAKNPEERYDSAGELAYELERAITESEQGLTQAAVPLPGNDATMIGPTPTGLTGSTGSVTPPPAPTTWERDYEQGVAAEARGDFHGAYEAFHRAYVANPPYRDVAVRVQNYERQGYRLQPAGPAHPTGGFPLTGTGQPTSGFPVTGTGQIPTGVYPPGGTQPYPPPGPRPKPWGWIVGGLLAGVFVICGGFGTLAAIGANANANATATAQARALATAQAQATAAAQGTATAQALAGMAQSTATAAAQAQAAATTAARNQAVQAAQASQTAVAATTERARGTATAYAVATATAQVANQAQATATVRAVATTMANLASRWRRVYGPVEGSLALNPQSSNVVDRAAGVTLKNFAAEAIFVNPFDRQRNPFDYGFRFRNSAKGEYRLYILSNDKWGLRYRESSDSTVIVEGNLTGLNTAANGTNRLTLVANNEVGYFFLNNTFVSMLDLTRHQEAGNVSAATSLFQGDALAGEATGYREFAVAAIE